jgi:uncharacterized hydrophobic protein (TIGR00271 family)
MRRRSPWETRAQTSVRARKLPEGAPVSRLGEAIHGGPVDAEEVARVRDVLLFEEPERRKRLIRFWVLLVLATAIATFGLLGDSVATVIGAMIVAPLMLPILGLALGISIGDRRAIIDSLGTAFAGMVVSIAVGYLLSLVIPSSFDPTSNAQIMARTAPNLVDLAAALATGLAGAFAMSRRDVSDTLPGVAIAISLVPPLANVGLLLSLGRVDLAMGSLLLFITNFFAILLTGTLVFGFLGFPRAAFVGHSERARRVAIAAVIAMLVVIVVPLGATSFTVLRDNLAEKRAATATRTWLEGSGYRLVSASAVDSEVDVVVTGTGVLQSETELARLLKGRLFGLPVRVTSLPSNTFVVRTE